MTTRGDVRLDIDTHEDGASAAARAMDDLNSKFDDFATMKLDSTINLLGAAKDALVELVEVAEDLEQRLNIRRAFEGIKEGADKLKEARIATAGLFSDTELMKRIMTMERLNMSTFEQTSLLESMTKIQQTSGEDAKAIFDKLIDTYKGSKDALKEFGIEVVNTNNALNEVAASLDNVDLGKFSTNMQQAAGSMEWLKDTTVDMWEAFRKGGVESVGPWRDATHGIKMTEAAMRKAAEASSSYDEFIGRLNERSRVYARTTWRIVSALKAQREATLKLAAAGGFRAAPEGTGDIATGEDAAVTTAAEAGLEAGKKAKKPKRGRARRREAPFDLDAVLALQDAQAAIADVDLEPLAQFYRDQSDELGRSTEMQQLQLDLQMQMTEGMGEQTVHMVDHATAIERQVIALQQRHEIESASLEHAQGLINAEEMRHRKAMANKKAEGRLVKLDMRADKQKRTIQVRESKRQKAEFDNQMTFWGDVGKAIGQTAAMLADNEQDRAGIMAAMAVLDATMAGIRIISDMGVAGIPLAAATIALGAATAAGYASASGKGAKPPAPGGFGAFTATALQERPDAAGAPVVMNFNAPGAAIGWTPQQVRSELGIAGDNGGMRGAAA
jgi:hypothetical protein